jgi:hypothetical protein
MYWFVVDFYLVLFLLPFYGVHISIILLTYYFMSQWPKEAVDSIIADYDVIDHDELNSSSSVGDRRQEIVFIGPGLAVPTVQSGVKEALDLCLLDDDEWDLYISKRSDEASLASSFTNTLPTRMLTY